MFSREYHSDFTSVTDGTCWARSSHCAFNGSCVEVSSGPAGEVWVRDGKDPGGGVLTFTRAAWRDFTTGVAAGQFPPD